MTDDWPSIAAVSKETAQYIGLISVEWQELQRLYDIYILAMTDNGIQGSFLTHKLNNSQKAAFIKASLCKFQNDPEGCEHIETFLKYAQICAENRNVLLHATGKTDPEAPDIITLEKNNSAWDKTRNTYLVPFDDLKRMANELYDVRSYGKLVLAAVRWGGPKRHWTPDGKTEIRVELPLPKIPPPPRTLASHLQEEAKNNA